MFWEMGAIMMTAGFLVVPAMVGAGIAIKSAVMPLARGFLRRRGSHAAALAWVNGRRK